MRAYADKVYEVYGQSSGAVLAEEIAARVGACKSVSLSRDINQSTAILISYGDNIQSARHTPLRALHAFSKEYFGGIISHIHLLPFYPYSSDDGFSVIDYTTIDPKLGDWNDIKVLETDFGLMFDYVLNHVSAQSTWFRGFLNDDPEYSDFFITLDPNTDVSGVRRPRTSPLLTPFETASGIKYVWTTFSADQIDLNYANPRVLLAMIDVLLLYVQKGAEFIRMDAVTYLWKELGTDCVHLRQAHLIVQIFRDILNEVAPHVQIITETNVPHRENISYFADGHVEAQGVYNFALPPLLAHTLQTGDKTAFESWAKSLALPSDETFFFNFTASHDGIGVTPVKEILSPEQIEVMIERVKGNGGLVSYKTAADGSEEPYELNTTYYNALSSPDEDNAVANKRFMVSQAIMLALKGIPGVYLGSLVGNKNWTEGVDLLGYNRAINREKLMIGENLSVEALQDESTERGWIYTHYRRLLEVRGSEEAFSPKASMEVVNLHDTVIALKRRMEGGGEVLALHSIVDANVDVPIEGMYIDLLTNQTYENIVRLNPYDIFWLKRR